jgi:hypothetical protein
VVQVPHDRPEVSQRMIETWIESVQQGLDDFIPQAAKQPQQQEGAQAAPGGQSSTVGTQPHPAGVSMS